MSDGRGGGGRRGEIRQWGLTGSFECFPIFSPVSAPCLYFAFTFWATNLSTFLFSLVAFRAKSRHPWPILYDAFCPRRYSGVLTQADFEEINPHMAKFLTQLKLLVEVGGGRGRSLHFGS